MQSRSAVLSRTGFTLIELLVVIAIIAILAAILFPVFAQAREKARAITCLSNQKEIGTALMMYVQDYDETFPMDQYDTSAPGGVPDDNTLRFWTDFVYPYLKNGDRSMDPASGQPITWGVGGVFSCPSFPDRNQSAQIGAHFGLMPDGACSWNPTASPVVTLAAITTPSDTVLLAELGRNDATWGWGVFFPDEGFWTDTVGNPPGSVDTHNDLLFDCDAPASSGVGSLPGCGCFPRYRHSMTANMACTDGHAKAMHRGGVDWYKNIYVSGVMPAPY
jgi:prepilin-type N-terminal cleavage/methylation domain-containing protein